MKRPGLILATILGLIVAAVALYLMFSGPRMRTQPKIMPYQALAPAVPAGVVTVEAEPSAAPSLEAMAPPRNPLPDTELTRRTGEVYYGYYCAFCHGDTGHGDGPVGYSYVPAPADLSAPRLVALSDGALCRAMLTGTGHEPTLGYVIPPKAPWYIVNYVRHLQAQP